MATGVDPNFNCSFTIPTGLAANDYVVTASTITNSATASANFNVTSLTLNPAFGAAGSVVTANGVGFIAGATISFTLDNLTVNGPVCVVASSATATPTATVTLTPTATVQPPPLLGTFSCTFSVPASLAPGGYAVTATDGTMNGLTSFTVVNSAVLGLNPASGAVGSLVVASGTGFTPSSSTSVAVTLSVDGTDATLGTCQTTSAGTFVCGLTIPPLPAGQHLVTATDSVGVTGSAPFTITSLALAPTSGSVGSTITANGMGFGAGRTVSFQLSGSVNGPIQASGSSCVVQSNGGFSGCTFQVPAGVATGAYTIVASDGNASASASFTVVASNLTLNPTSGPVGSQVTVTGSGFGASAAVSLMLDGQPIVGAPCAANAAGAISCTFTMPLAAAGSHVVTANSTAGVSASAPFSVTSLSVVPSSGVAGATVMANGAGFPANQLIVFSLGSQSAGGQLCQTQADGTFSNCSVTIPATATVGKNQILSATGGNVSSNTSFAVTSLTLVAASGATGYTVQVTGAGFGASQPVHFVVNGQTIGTFCITNSSGALTAPCSFTVASPGVYSVTATDGTYTATGSFTATPTWIFQVGSEPVGALVNGTVGAVVTATNGLGFAPNSTVSFTIGSTSVVGSTCATNANGAFTGCTFSVPSLLAGTYQVNATDTKGNVVPAGPAGGPIEQLVVVANLSSVSPSAGPVGATITVSGTAFGPGRTVTFQLTGGPSGTVPLPGPTCVVQTNGSFAGCTFPLPSAATGAYSLVASDGSATASASFSVVATQISLNPTSGPVGSQVTVTGGGFAANTAVSLLFDGQPVAGESCPTDGSGNISCTFAVPSVAVGSHVVTANGTVNGGTVNATATFTVTSLSVVPSSGVAGATVLASGAGFRPNQVMVFSLGALAAGGQLCQSQANGTFTNCSVTIPVSATVGSGQTLKVTDGSLWSNTSFAVTSLALSVSSGSNGFTVQVTGAGFTKGATVYFFVNNQAIQTTCTADSSGNLSNCSFLVGAAGVYTVTAADGTVTATGSFTATPAWSFQTSTLTPASVITSTIGATLTTTRGFGFAPNSTVKFTVGSTTAFSPICPTDANGTINQCTFSVPALLAGVYQVYATDGQNNVVEATLSDGTPEQLAVQASLGGTPLSFSVQEGSAFNGPLLTFTDSSGVGTLQNFTPSIQWGDGITTEIGDSCLSNSSSCLSFSQISGGGGAQAVFQVAGKHSYLTYGAYTVTIPIREQNLGSISSSVVTFTLSASVSDAPLSSTGNNNVTVVEGQPLASGSSSVTLATVYDLDPNSDPSRFLTTVDWGDGTAVQTGHYAVFAGAATGGSTQFNIVADTSHANNHIYTQQGGYSARVTVADQHTITAGSTTIVVPGGQSTLTTASVNVGDAQISTKVEPTCSGTVRPPAPCLQAKYGQPLSHILVATVTDQNGFATALELNANGNPLIDWGDGSVPTAADEIVPEPNQPCATSAPAPTTPCVFDIYGSHTYPALQTNQSTLYTVTVYVNDVGGAVSNGQGQLLASNANPNFYPRIWVPVVSQGGSP